MIAHHSGAQSRRHRRVVKNQPPDSLSRTFMCFFRSLLRVGCQSSHEHRRRTGLCIFHPTTMVAMWRRGQARAMFLQRKWLAIKEAPNIVGSGADFLESRTRGRCDARVGTRRRRALIDWLQCEFGKLCVSTCAATRTVHSVYGYTPDVAQ